MLELVSSNALPLKLYSQIRLVHSGHGGGGGGGGGNVVGGYGVVGGYNVVVVGQQ